MNTDRSFGSGKISRGAHRRLAEASSDDAVWSAEAATLRVSIIDPIEDDAATVLAAGELDLASAPLVDRALQKVTASRRRRVRLDLSAVSFCDCAGLSAVIAGDSALRTTGARLTLISPSTPVRRLLTLAKLEHLIDRADE